MACAAIIYAAFYLAGLAVLGVGLVVTLAASRIHAHRVARRGQPPDAPRGAGNIIANCGIGALAAVLEIANLGVRTEFTALCCVTAIAAGASDTVASEFGKAFGGPPRAFPTGRVVPPGTPGAVSILGSVAGLAAALMIAAPAAMLWLIGWTAVLHAAAGSTIGAFVESTAATLYGRDSEGINHVLNGLNTLTAAVAALLLAVYSRP